MYIRRVMNLTVIPDLANKSRGTLICGERSYACALGRGGVRADKHEGDGATPAGVFSLRRLFYRPDRLEKPVCGLPITPMAPDDGWCDAPDDPAYNTLVHLPIAASAENLWREDRVYDLIAVIGYNDAPVAPGKGSAIFMHVATPDLAPTAGCVALTKDDLLSVLKDLGVDSMIAIQR